MGGKSLIEPGQREHVGEPPPQPDEVKGDGPGGGVLDGDGEDVQPGGVAEPDPRDVQQHGLLGERDRGGEPGAQDGRAAEVDLTVQHHQMAAAETPVANAQGAGHRCPPGSLQGTAASLDRTVLVFQGRGRTP
ncbi:hypothetical protein GCM10010468_64600 [Actinocorallia longicatena]|uniref:Uncharacterized protein n=1 Tax=Actinocorallia longicatena TaxID=111803 RepID=A0ABP6QIY1_9ACTN